MFHESEERPGRGARRQGEGDRTELKNSILPVVEATAAYTPKRRKSPRDLRRAALLAGMGVPPPWRRLADVVTGGPQ